MTVSTPARSDTAARGKVPPGPRGHFLLGNLREIQQDRLGYLYRLMLQYGDIVQYRATSLRLYQVNHPDGIQRVLQDNLRNYTRAVITFDILRVTLGDSLLTTDGTPWLRQRRLMQPVFHKQRIAAFGEIMTNTTAAMLERWERHAAQGQPLDAAAEMMRLTMKIVTQALFSTEVDDETRAIASAMTALVEDSTVRFDMPFYPPLRVPTPHNRRVRAALHTLDAIMYRMIAAHRAGHAPAGDLLSLLIAARDEETGAGMSDRQLRDEVITLFSAGHETTANALAWSWYLLSQHPAAEQRLHDELDAVLGGRTPSVADLPQLPYTRMVIEEAMRLYPPVWITNRKAEAEDELCGYHIPAGAVIAISPYVMHRHPAYWERPEVFDPERFTPERSAGRPHYAYFPFLGGPHQCIGKSFAQVEAQLVLAMVAQRYRLRLMPGHPVVPQALTTLRPRDGLRMAVERRGRQE